MEIKIPFYNILNILLTGLIFIFIFMLFFPDYILIILNNKVIETLFVKSNIFSTVCALSCAYEIGLIINRIGSVIVEYFLKKVNLITFNNDYKQFNEKKKEYPIISILSREYALSRTGIALFLVLLILALISHKWLLASICALITIIYYLSCRKHSSKIVELMGVREAKYEN